MSNVYQFSSPDQRIDEASLWLYKLDRGLSVKERKDLKKWLAESKQNQQVFIEMVEMWDEMDILSNLADLFPKPIKDEKPVWLSGAVAASFIAIVISFFFIDSSDWAKPEPQKTIAVTYDKDLYQTTVGEQSKASLSDGTQIILNTNTLVKVSYTDKQRFLILEHGELHVDVAHDELRPLSVIAGDKILQAVGTAFNVEMKNNELIELMVTEGKVLVISRNSEANELVSAKTEMLAESSFSVSQGQKLMLGVPAEKVEIIEPGELQAKLSWQDGTLVFQGEPLSEVIKEISRYTQIEFVLKNRSIKDTKVIGLFRTGDVNGLVTTLRDNFNMTVSHNVAENKILLDKKTKPKTN